MATKYFEILHVLIYANYLRRFYFHLSVQLSTFYSEQNDTNIIFVSRLVKKQEHSSPLRPFSRDSNQLLIMSIFRKLLGIIIDKTLSYAFKNVIYNMLTCQI